MQISLSIPTLVYIIIAVVLVFLVVMPRKSNGGSFTPDTSSLVGCFWAILLIIITLVFGGIFWW